jgi:hypothetical protein
MLRAVLSERYARLDNPAIMERVITQFQDTYTPISLDLTDTAFHLRLIKGEQADLSLLNVGDIAHSGLIITNSETGMGALKLLSLVYRLKCRNGMVGADERAFQSKAHLGKDFEMQTFFSASLASLQSYFGFVIRQLRNAHNDVYHPEQAVALVQYLAKHHLWNQPFVARLQEHLPQEERSKFGLIQAVTEVAKQWGPEERLRLERQATELLRYDLATLSEHAVREAALISAN